MANTKQIAMFATDDIALDSDKNWCFGKQGIEGRKPVFIPAEPVCELTVPTEQVRIIDAGRISAGKLVGVSSQWVLVQGDIFYGRDRKDQVYHFSIGQVGFDLGVERRCEVKPKQAWIDNYLNVEGWKYGARKDFIDRLLADNARMELIKGFANGTFQAVAIEKTDSGGEMASVLNVYFREDDMEVLSGSIDDYRMSLRDLYDERFNALEKNQASDKIKAILTGEAVVVGDDWLDQHDLPEGVVTIPNPKRVGVKDQYLAGLISHPMIQEYRAGQGITDPDDGPRMG